MVFYLTKLAACAKANNMVISIPSYYGQVPMLSILDSADIAGIQANVLSEHDAIALAYAYSKRS